MHDDVIVFPTGRIGSDTDKLARHTEVKHPDQALRQRNQNVFSSATNLVYLLAGKSCQSGLVDADPQARLQYFNSLDGPSDQMRPQTPAYGFDFGQFRHQLQQSF
jgi:hypothetical protein